MKIKLSGQNSIIVILGANLLLTEDDLNQAEEIIRQSKVVVCQLEIRQETVRRALELARKHQGKSFSCTPLRHELTIRERRASRDQRVN